jgi:hypothetical protein
MNRVIKFLFTAWSGDPAHRRLRDLAPGFCLICDQTLQFPLAPVVVLNTFQKLKVLISCHPDDLHIVFDDEGRDFLIFGNDDRSDCAGICIDKMIAMSSDISAAGGFENLDLNLIRCWPDC